MSSATKIVMPLISILFFTTNLYAERICTKENIRILQDKCEQRDGAACAKLGSIYVVVKNRTDDCPEDDVKAAEYDQKACDLENYGACSRLAGFYFHGRGVKKDYKKAVELDTKACEENIFTACYNLGELYRVGEIKGKDVIKDLTKAEKSYRKACESGDKDCHLACYRLGMMYLDGKGVTQNHAEAAHAFNACCSRSESLKMCCEELNKLCRDKKFSECKEITEDNNVQKKP
jgi:TPR repeat protein